MEAFQESTPNAEAVSGGAIPRGRNSNSAFLSRLQTIYAESFIGRVSAERRRKQSLTQRKKRREVFGFLRAISPAFWSSSVLLSRCVCVRIYMRFAPRVLNRDWVLLGARPCANSNQNGDFCPKNIQAEFCNPCVRATWVGCISQTFGRLRVNVNTLSL